MASSPSYIPYLCVAAAAFITTFLTVPLVKRLAIKLDAVDYPSKRRINTKPIPRLGGTAVFLGLVVACTVQILGTWYLGWPPVLVPHPLLHISYPILALSFTVIFATGAIDDIYQLKPKQKLAGQVLAALIACVGGLRIGVIERGGEREARARERQGRERRGRALHQGRQRVLWRPPCTAQYVARLPQGRDHGAHWAFGLR